MAQVNQLGSIAISGGDLQVKNYGGSDIAAKRAVIVDAVNIPGGAGSNPVGVTLPASSANAFGITLTTIVASRLGTVRLLGAAVAVASATIVVGDLLMTDAAGKVLPQTAGLNQIGRALSSAANTEDVLVWIATAKNA